MARIALVCTWERWKHEIVDRDARLTSWDGRMAETPDGDTLIHISSPKRARQFTFDEVEVFYEWDDAELIATANVVRSRLSAPHSERA